MREFKNGTGSSDLQTNGVPIRLDRPGSGLDSLKNRTATVDSPNAWKLVGGVKPVVHASRRTDTPSVPVVDSVDGWNFVLPEEYGVVDSRLNEIFSGMARDLNNFINNRSAAQPTPASTPNVLLPSNPGEYDAAAYGVLYQRWWELARTNTDIPVKFAALMHKFTDMYTNMISDYDSPTLEDHDLLTYELIGMNNPIPQVSSWILTRLVYPAVSLLVGLSRPFSDFGKIYCDIYKANANDIPEYKTAMAGSSKSPNPAGIYKAVITQISHEYGYMVDPRESGAELLTRIVSSPDKKIHINAIIMGVIRALTADNSSAKISPELAMQPTTGDMKVPVDPSAAAVLGDESSANRLLLETIKPRYQAIAAKAGITSVLLDEFQIIQGNYRQAERLITSQMVNISKDCPDIRGGQAPSPKAVFPPPYTAFLQAADSYNQMIKLMIVSPSAFTKDALAKITALVSAFTRMVSEHAASKGNLQPEELREIVRMLQWAVSDLVIKPTNMWLEKMESLANVIKQLYPVVLDNMYLQMIQWEAATLGSFDAMKAQLG